MLFLFSSFRSSVGISSSPSACPSLICFMAAVIFSGKIGSVLRSWKSFFRCCFQTLFLSSFVMIKLPSSSVIIPLPFFTELSGYFPHFPMGIKVISNLITIFFSMASRVFSADDVSLVFWGIVFISSSFAHKFEGNKLCRSFNYPWYTRLR